MRRLRWCSILGIGFCILLIIAARARTYSAPQHGDTLLYALIGHEVAQGRTLYSDLWDNKPPAVYWTYAAASRLTGLHDGLFFFLNLTANIISLVGIFFAIHSAFGFWMAAMGGLTWTLLSGDLCLGANQAFIEIFLNALFPWIFALLLESAKRARRRTLIVSGILIAATVLYKQSAVFIAGALLIGYAHSFIALSPDSVWKRCLASLGFILSPCILVGSLVLCDLAFHHSVQDFWAATVTFNQFYAQINGSFLERLGRSFALRNYDPIIRESFLYLLPLLCFSTIGFVIARQETHRRFFNLWLALAAGTFCAVALPGYFYPHYFQLWFPVLALGSAGTIGVLATTRSRWQVIALGCILVSGLLGFESRYYFLSPDAWSVRQYGNELLITRSIGRDLHLLLAPDETLYNWGTQYGLYYWSGKPVPTGVFDAYPLITGPLVRPLTDRVSRDLFSKPPELLIALSDPPSDEAFIYTHHPLWRALQPRYRRFIWPGHEGSFIYLARRKGALESRILRGETTASFQDLR